MTLRPLSPQQRRVLMYVAFRIDTGPPPTHQEVLDWFGWKSLNYVVLVYKALVNKGYLYRDRGVARGVRLSEAYKEYRDQWLRRRKQKRPASPSSTTSSRPKKRA
jgi:SOS-response transcriptional repressor LexA